MDVKDWRIETKKFGIGDGKLCLIGEATIIRTGDFDIIFAGPGNLSPDKVATLEAAARSVVNAFRLFRPLVAACAEAEECAQHADNCRYWNANGAELSTPDGNAAAEAGCNCFISTLRRVIAELEGSVRP